MGFGRNVRGSLCWKHFLYPVFALVKMPRFGKPGAAFIPDVVIVLGTFDGICMPGTKLCPVFVFVKMPPFW